MSLCDRAFCQIKTFCDKGAERKAREEEKRMTRGSNSTFGINIQPRSIFQRAFDFSTEPVFYTPKETTVKEMPAATADAKMEPRLSSLPKNPGYVNEVKYRPHIRHVPSTHTVNGIGIYERVMLYAKQVDEEVFRPFHVVPPNVQGLVRAVSTQYQIESADIRYIFRQTSKGILVKMDDDMVRFYSNGDVFIMKVLATEDAIDGATFYDVVFIEQDIGVSQKELNKATTDNNPGPSTSSTPNNNQAVMSSENNN